MKEQTYTLQNIKSFEPKQIFECGQCFRWNLEADGSYTGVFNDNILNVKKEQNDVKIKGICNQEIDKLCIQYFDLDRDYETIKKQLSKIDATMEKSVLYGNGIRLLNQDIWETLISFVISANNNIPRIKKIIEKLSKKYGTKIKWGNKQYYTFPTPEQLKNVSVEELRETGLGFRDKYIAKTTQMVIQGEIRLEELNQIKETKHIREKLMQFPGVGEKVADCILLFSTLKRLDAFPVDVWVRRVMQELYFPDKTQLGKEQIQKIAHEKFSNLAGIAQQYLFYWRREA